MKIGGIVWLREIVDKLAWKHAVTVDEVDEALRSATRFRRLESGDVAGEDLYATLGRTRGGRYLIVFFVHKVSGEALIVSARDATTKERKAYGKR